MASWRWVRLLVGLVVVGGRRLRHAAYVADDPVFRRFTGLGGLPTARTVSRWLKQFTMTTVGRLQDLNAGVVARVLPALRLCRRKGKWRTREWL